MENILTDMWQILLGKTAVAIGIMPLAMLSWWGTLRLLDVAAGINFGRVYAEWDADSRARYHGMRALAAAIVCAAVFF